MALVKLSPFQLEVLKDLCFLPFTPFALPFSVVREKVRYYLHLLFQGFNNTQVVENGFNRLRFREAHDRSSGDNIQRWHLWAWLFASEVLTRRHRRPEVKVKPRPIDAIP